MDLKRLEYLLQVAEFGSFTKAASVIGIAQPALGRQVQKLELECGVRLLYRHGRGVTLTPEGETLLERVRPLVKQLREAGLDLREEGASVSGVVTVGMTPTVCTLIGLPLIMTMRKKYPKLEVNIVSGYSGYVHEWLMDARLDLAILHDARRSQHLLVEPLAAAKLSVISSPESVPASERSMQNLPLKRIAGMPLVLPTKNHGLRRTLEFAASRAGIRLDVQFEIDTLALLTDVVRAGLAHTILAMPAVQREVEHGHLLARRICEPEVETRLMIAKAANRPLARAVQAVETEIKNEMRRAAADIRLDLGLESA